MTRRRLAPRALVPALLLAALAGAARAENPPWTVNITEDVANPSAAQPTIDVDPFTLGAQVSLRAAIQKANNDAGADTIIVPEGLFKLTLKGDDEDAAVTGDLDITDDLTIIGVPANPQTGADGTILDGKKLKDRLFEVEPGVTLTLKSFTLRNAKAPKAESGGALRVLGSLVMDHVIVTKCKSTVDGGGIEATASADALTLTDVFFFKNTATGDGGAIHVAGGLTEVTRATFQKNKASSEGGALELTEAMATLTNVTLNANSAKVDGGAMLIRNGSVLTLVNITSCGNVCKLTSGLSAFDTGGMVASNTVLARNAVFDDKGERNFSGYGAQGVISLGGNIESGTSCKLPVEEFSSTDPHLLKLGYFGGFTPTCPIDVDSPAIDNGADNGAPDKDQRGVPRVGIDGVGLPFVECDSGAYEFTQPVQ
jgi:predicted outer membrane repeat protein